MTRPTVGTVSGELTSSSVSATIDATCRALWVVLFGSSNTTFTHAAATISIGGVSIALHETRSTVQVHCCGYSAADISARTSSTISIGGVSLGSAVNQYRWRYFNICHPSHGVVRAAAGGNNANANGGTFLTSLAVGGSGQARALAPFLVQSGSGGAGSSSGFTSGSDHFSNVGGPAGTSHEKWASSGEITGTTSVGWNMGAGSNTQRAMVATAWTEGAPLVTPRSRAYVLATIPAWPWTAGL